MTCLLSPLCATVHALYDFPTDENNTESDSDPELQNEASCSRSERALALNLKCQEPWNRSALGNSDSNRETTPERTTFRPPRDKQSAETDSSKEPVGEIREGLLPVMSRSLPSLSSGNLHAVDFSSAHSQQFLKLGVPLLFHPGQLSGKPEAFPIAGTGQVSSSLPGANDLESGGLCSPSFTSPPPFMFHVSQNMLASQVRYSSSTVL